MIHQVGAMHLNSHMLLEVLRVNDGLVVVVERWSQVEVIVRMVADLLPAKCTDRGLIMQAMMPRTGVGHGGMG